MNGTGKPLAEVIRDAGGMTPVSPVCQEVTCGKDLGRYEARIWSGNQIALTEIPKMSPGGRPFGRLPSSAGVEKRPPAPAYYRGPKTGRGKYELEFYNGLATYRWRCGCGRHISRRGLHLAKAEARWNERKDRWEVYL